MVTTTCRYSHSPNLARAHALARTHSLTHKHTRTHHACSLSHPGDRCVLGWR